MNAADNLRTLPNFKRDATPYERLSELALYAREHPERFDRFVLCYVERLPDNCSRYRNISFGCNLAEEVGLYEIGKAQAMKESES